MDLRIRRSTQLDVSDRSPLGGGSLLNDLIAVTGATTMIITTGLGITEPAVVVFRR